MSQCTQSAQKTVKSVPKNGADMNYKDKMISKHQILSLCTCLAKWIHVQDRVGQMWVPKHH